MCFQAAERSGSVFLGNFALDLQDARGKFFIACLGKECIKTAALVHGTQGVSRNAQLIVLTQCVGTQRNLHQVGKETTLGLDTCLF